MVQAEDTYTVGDGHSRVKPDGYIHYDSNNWLDLRTIKEIQMVILRNKISHFSYAKLFNIICEMAYVSPSYR